MSKINTLDKLVSKIDRELSWRKVELTEIYFDLQAQSDQPDNTQQRFIKYGIVLLYSHWEGSVKTIAEYYLNYVSCQKLNYKELKRNFLMLGVKDLIEVSGGTKKSTKRTELISTIFSKQNEPSNIPVNSIISANSNLNFEILEEILATIGISLAPFNAYSTWIDSKLLQNRNYIAHGENFNRLDGVVTLTEYSELHNKITKAIDLFAETIKDAAQNEDYRIEVS
ncbi:TPA: hypothetical protein U5Y80_001045 [Streptococcus agalactiae]|nr:hypothetical protein [Streptococcus agalactiae]